MTLPVRPRLAAHVLARRHIVDGEPRGLEQDTWWPLVHREYRSDYDM